MTAYHFVGKALRDGSPIPPEGKWLEFVGEPILCKQGLHASLHPFDALKYASGATLCLVELGGKIVECNDKVVATRRKIIKRVDLTETLRYFARIQALSVVHLWDAPELVLDYLMTGNESLREAAKKAAWNAVKGATWGGARYAAWNAAREAAWNSAEATTWTIARTARRKKSIWTTIRRDFKQLVDEALA